jgi:hypothetical protein
VNAALNIVFDIVVLGMPITQLLGLSFHWKKKLAAGLMFGVGFL